MNHHEQIERSGTTAAALKKKIGKAQAKECKFGLGALAVGFAMFVLVGAALNFGVSFCRGRNLFLRGHKDDEGPSSSAGAACDAEKTCSGNSFCDAVTCTTCGGDGEICCGLDEAILEDSLAPEKATCNGNLECDFDSQLALFGFLYTCRKCWEDKLDRCGVDSTCCDPATTCIDGACVKCGKDGEQCCYDFRSDARCVNGLDCVINSDKCATCVAKDGDCDDSDKPCCGYDDNELYCDGNGKCVECGGKDQPACYDEIADESSCDNDDLVTNGIGDCVDCGAIGEQCCDSKTCDLDTLICNGVMCEMCVATGGDCSGGDPCCKGNNCDREDKKCVACGADGQYCCENGSENGNACNDDLGCDDNTGKCSACGDENQPCCQDESCASGLACDNSICLACGGFTELCCGSIQNVNKCDDGFACNDRIHPNKCDKCAGELESCGDIPCCSGNQDNTNRLFCGGDNLCIPCGGKGEVCCDNDFLPLFCNEGLFCNCDGSCTDNAFEICFPPPSIN